MRQGNGVTPLVASALSFIALALIFALVVEFGARAATNPQLKVFIVVQALFWLLTGGVVLLPPRAALLSLALLMHVDASAPGLMAASWIGWENPIKGLVLPVLILWRLAPRQSGKYMWTKTGYSWPLLMLYVGLAAVWSPYKIAAAKMEGYLFCYLILFWAFYWGWRRGVVDGGFVALAIWGSTALACLQSFVLGNPLDPIERRFSSFCWAQEFAAWTVSALAVVLFYQGQLRFRKATIACGITATVLTGSRFAFAGLACLLLVFWLQRSIGRGHQFKVMPLLKSVSAAGFTIIVLCALVLYFAPTNRLREVLLFGTERYQSASDIGTLNLRLVIYGAALSDIADRSLPELIFGSGTSTEGEVLVKYGLGSAAGFKDDDYVDPNRGLNSDMLRSLYEWGLVGLSLASFLIVRLLGWVWRLAFGEWRVSGFALLGLIPTVLFGLISENVLAASASALGVGFVLVIAWAFADQDLRCNVAACDHVGSRGAISTAKVYPALLCWAQ